MMKYTLRPDQFCALSREPQWQTWLDNMAPDLGKKLREHLHSSKSCKSNRELMQIIRKELENRGFGKKLVEFLSKVYPVTLKITPDQNDESSKPKTGSIITKFARMSNKDLNKHGVFKSYRPHILTLPHKLIIYDTDQEELRKRVNRFMKIKIFTDHIIIEDRAYVEFFESRFRKEAEDIDAGSREIAQYRKKLEMNKELKMSRS